MANVEERLSENFYQWELCGRGWKLWDDPVIPEPPFRPFPGHSLPSHTPHDDGKRESFLSSLVKRLTANPEKQTAGSTEECEALPEAVRSEHTPQIEFRISLSPESHTSIVACENFLQNLCYCKAPIVFELIGTAEEITAQWAVSQDDAETMQHQLDAHFPDAVHIQQKDFLEETWFTSKAEESGVFEFGLEHEFMIPLAYNRNFDPDPYIGLIGALSRLGNGDVAVYQVIFMPTHAPWAENIHESVTDNDGKNLFVNRQELVKEAKMKTSKLLFGAILRIAIKSDGRIFDIARDMAGSMAVFSHPGANELIPLSNAAYDPEHHEIDLILRQSRRSGMLLNSDELVSLVHPPSSSVRSPKLKREAEKSKPAPENTIHRSGLTLGSNTHAGATQEVSLDAEQRVRHTYIIGASGTGKSTLMLNLIEQDMQNGQGLAVFDPHGDLIDQILGAIPEHRINDVVLVDPADETYSVGFNILTARTELEKNLLASDLVSVFQRLSTSWGDQMTSVLNNTILAFLESNRGGTLVDLQRFLIEPNFRKQFLTTVKDEQVLYYWENIFPQLTGNKSVGPIITRLGSFLDRKPIRRMVTQTDKRIDFADIMDSGKIFLARLPQGQIGNENASLLGSFLVSKFQQTVMARQAKDAASRRDFWMYIDEFHNFISPSMGQILSGARKYRLGLTLAHQELRQLQRESEVASAALSNPCTRICFRVGDDDARKIGSGFSFFDAADIQSLPNFHAICRVERADCDFNLTLPPPLAVNMDRQLEIADRAITASRNKYGTKNDENSHHDNSTPQEEAPALSSAIGEPVNEATVTINQTPDNGPLQIPSEPGKGGEQHRATQQRLKSEAIALGFGVSIEKNISGTRESIDVVVEKSDLVIACEICVSTSVDHELGNVRKCLRAGYTDICAIFLDAKRMKQFQEASGQCLAEEEQAKLHCIQPEAFQAKLKELLLREQLPITGSESDRVLGKYKVTSKYTKLDEAERLRKEEMLRQVIADALKSK